MPPKTDATTANATTNASPSRVQQIADLAVGESTSFAQRLDGDEATKDAIIAARKSLLNTVASAVKRARDKTGATYTVENGEITTRSLDILCVVVATRTA